ncbi:hypothetical protein BDY24DRAFT_390392 [Mrakia frigida]|uniref:uncharacterized protein n=1 Tax=Mrakia frigida TaxID=29902 RepID=UPI003FCC272D
MTKLPKPAPGIAADGTIFKATYSGVPVYEMICKTVAVMRRRSDAWLNATQILKVAGFDKPQRTRVLEREVQKGEHEKVQGGYGKYQGTWIPIERGLALSKQYGVEHLMRPIIDYIPTATSPPLAPKHITAQPVRNPKKNKDGTPIIATPGGASGSGSNANTPGSVPKTSQQAKAKAEAATILAAERKEKRDRDREEKKLAAERVQRREASLDLADSLNGGSGEDGDSMTDASLGGSESSRTPSPILGSGDEYDDDDEVDGRKRKFRGDYEPSNQRGRYDDGYSGGGDYLGGGPEKYEDIILDYFISETSQIPSILINPPLDFDPNVPIDDDGHTALHWACAMGRIRVVKLLLTSGADIFRVNHAEQTALMRSVMFSNNYDVRKFPELYELLHRSTLNIDKTNRTVFHHIADVALSKGKTHAARYYMETILGRLADYPKELGDVINFQDDEGETALTLAARARSKRLVKSLLDHGADPKLANRDGKTAEDYILEDERFRSSPVQATGGLIDRQTGTGATGVYNQSHASNGSLSSNPHPNGFTVNNPNLNQPQASTSSSSAPATKIYHSQTAQLAAGRSTADLTALLASLAKSFDVELLEKGRDVSQANAILTGMEGEISESKRTSETLRLELGTKLEEGKQTLERLEKELETKIGGRYAKGWKDWSASEAAREQAYLVNPAGGEEDLKARLDVGAGAGGLEEEKKRLEAKVQERKARRVELFGRYVRLLAESGTGEEMGKYRKIINAAAGLKEVGGGGESGDLDGIMEGLLEALETEQSSTSMDYTPEAVVAPTPPSFQQQQPVASSSNLVAPMSSYQASRQNEPSPIAASIPQPPSAVPQPQYQQSYPAPPSAQPQGYAGGQ